MPKFKIFLVSLILCAGILRADFSGNSFFVGTNTFVGWIGKKAKPREMIHMTLIYSLDGSLVGNYSYDKSPWKIFSLKGKVEFDKDDPVYDRHSFITIDEYPSPVTVGRVSVKAKFNGHSNGGGEIWGWRNEIGSDKGTDFELIGFDSQGLSGSYSSQKNDTYMHVFVKGDKLNFLINASNRRGPCIVGGSVSLVNKRAVFEMENSELDLDATNRIKFYFRKPGRCDVSAKVNHLNLCGMSGRDFDGTYVKCPDIDCPELP